MGGGNEKQYTAGTDNSEHLPLTQDNQINTECNTINKDKYEISKDAEVKETRMDEWETIIWYNPDQVGTELDEPAYDVEQESFEFFIRKQEQDRFLEDLLLAHKVLDSGVPNRWGCRIPVRSNWRLEEFSALLNEYHDIEIIEWLRYGFPISREDSIEDPTLATANHLGATRFPQDVDNYIEKEIQLGATMGPFNIPPFINRIGVSPLSTRPKKDANSGRIIMDLSFPERHSVNDGINKEMYCGRKMDLTYLTIDMLAERISSLGTGCLLWKKDLLRYFRQILLCPHDFSLIGFRWRNKLYFDKMVPMGLRSAAYIAQRLTNSIVHIHRRMEYWSINYLDDFGSAEKEQDAWNSYMAMDRILRTIRVDEATEKSVEPTTRMDFLGNTVDTIKMTIEVSQDRQEELMDLLEK